MGAYGSPEMLDYINHPKRCKKCGAIVTGKFCSECGTEVQRGKVSPRWWIPYFITLVAFVSVMLFATASRRDLIFPAIFVAVFIHSATCLLIGSVIFIARLVQKRPKVWIKNMMLASLSLLIISFFAVAITGKHIESLPNATPSSQFFASSNTND